MRHVYLARIGPQNPTTDDAYSVGHRNKHQRIRGLRHLADNFARMEESRKGAWLRELGDRCDWAAARAGRLGRAVVPSQATARQLTALLVHGCGGEKSG